MLFANIFNIERAIILALLITFGISTVARAESDLVLKSKGRAPAKMLKVKQSKVPTFEIHKIKNGIIPRLDIGEEASFEAKQLTQEAGKNPQFQLNQIQKKASLAVIDIDLKKLALPAATVSKKLTQAQSLGKIPEVKPLKEIQDAKISDTELATKAIRDMNISDYKLLESLIYLEEHKKYELALGLLTELAKEKDYQTEALFHSALAAQALGISSEFYSMMIKINNESKKREWQVDAVTELTRYIESLKISDMKTIDPLVQKYEIDITQNEAYNFYRAKFYLEDGHLGQVEDALALIPEKSKYYKEALLISALYNYRRGKIDNAIFDLEKLMKDTAQGESVRSPAAMTLARIQFQKAQYKDAFKTYTLVDKGHALWLQAAVEQAWAQILAEDYEGAAGNMFTLHTDFFKNAFAPESYVVRSVSYLNLCQFGDGMQVLHNLQKKYAPAKARLDAYKKDTKEKMKYYESVKTWLKKPELREVDGLPRSFIIELARHPSFLKVQSQINDYEDEIERYNKANIYLIQREKDLLKKQSEARDQIAKNQKAIKDSKQINTEMLSSLKNNEKRLASYKMQYVTVNKARGLIKIARENAINRIDKEKTILREKAALALKDRFDQVLAELTHVLEQNEVLRYEIFSGAGEHLRYQLGGGEINAKENAQNKPEPNKAMQWKFQGEIWEDEIGHFRSSLKNVCPKDEKIAAK